MQSEVLKAKAIDLFDMSLLGILLGMSYAGATHSVLSLF